MPFVESSDQYLSQVFTIHKFSIMEFSYAKCKNRIRVLWKVFTFCCESSLIKLTHFHNFEHVKVNAALFSIQILNQRTLRP